MSRTVYVDNNATTRVADEVVEEMLPYFSELYGNPSSMHTFGGQLHKRLEGAREKVADLMGAEPSEITFTSCGTESDNAAIRGVLESFPRKRHIVTTKVEHPGVLNLCRHLPKHGYELTEIGVDHEGMLDLDELRAAIRDDTAIVSIMHANNETGVIFPVEEVAQIVKEKGAIFHSDAVQAVGKLPVDMSKSNIDLLALSGHKLHAPKGVGALYVRKGVKCQPFIIGGHHEDGRRAGTENVPYIMGLGKACELAKDEIKKQIRKRIEADPALKQEIKDAVALYIDAKAKETYATIRLAKAGAKIGLELIPKDMRGQVAKEFLQIFEDELEDLFNKTL